MNKNLNKMYGVAEVYKKVVNKAIADGYAVLSDNDRNKIISEKGALDMSNAFIDSIIESAEKLMPFIELLSK